MMAVDDFLLTQFTALEKARDVSPYVAARSLRLLLACREELPGERKIRDVGCRFGARP